MKRQLNRQNTTFLSGVHILGIVGAVYMMYNFLWPTVFLAIAMFLTCGLSLTAGYHRLLSHGAFVCPPWLKRIFLFFASGGFQNYAKKWAADHRMHHEYADTIKDPYNVLEGFWYAHIGWICFKRDDPDYELPMFRDLVNDLDLKWQEKYYILLGVLSGFAIPIIIALFLGDPMGGLLVAGFLRLVVQYHTTGFVNSAAHYFGKKPYDFKSTACDNAVVAVITLGEGNHNFHHKYASDYRNGIRWYQCDPTKWLIWCFEKIGVAWGLTRTPEILWKYN